MSAIYEVDSKLKKVFQEQNSVKFQKEWYFWDEVKINNKPDFNYLKTIEKKYNINLWLWAYNFDIINYINSAMMKFFLLLNKRAGFMNMFWIQQNQII